MRRTHRAWCLLLALWCLAWPAAAAPTSSLRFQHLNETGNISILALMQDRLGFVWIGTQSGGLFRYDGYEAVNYTHRVNDLRSVPHSRVFCLMEDAEGRIWVGTRGGLARFDPVTNDFTRFTPPPGPASRLDIKAIVSDGKRGLWLATWGGVQHFDPDTGRFEMFVHQPGVTGSLAHNDVNALAVDARGGLWAATWPEGLDYLPAGSKVFQHFQIDQGKDADSRLNIVRALRFDAAHTLWIGTESGVVTWRDGSPWRSHKRIESPAVRVNQLYLDGDGTMWAGTISEGLLRWKKNRRSPTRYVYRPGDPYSLPADNVRAMLVDRSGMVWAGTFTEGIGLANLYSAGFKRIIPYDAETANQRPNNMLPAIAGAAGGRIWLGGSSGFALFAPGSGEVVQTYRADPRRPQALSSNLVYSLFQQPGGTLWVGTAAGLNRLDQFGGTFTVVRFQDIADDFINTISAGSGNTLWLGTGGSVIHYNAGSGAFKSYKHDDADPHSRSVNGANCVVEDRYGRVWIGSETGGGLDLLDKHTGKVRNFRHSALMPSTISSDFVTALYEDSRGRLWVGTDRGLNEIIAEPDGSIRFRRFSVPDNGEVRILAILSDLAGKIWLSTSGGLVQLDTLTGKASLYVDADGVSDTFTVGSAYAAPDGILYFGGTKGMTAVNPLAVQAKSVAPQVAITDVTVFNRSVKKGVAHAVSVSGPVTAPTSLTLSAQDAVFSIEFAALHYAAPRKNRYAYRLDGFDRDWIGADALHRTATYTNLAPGQYVFRVAASNDRGVWGRNEATLAVTILPRYWQTWWFRILAGVLAIGLICTLYWIRMRRFVRNQLQLEALVAVRTREMEEVNAKLAELSTTDGLTGITNRRGFDIALRREWAHATRRGDTVALALVDVDHFKLYNDHYGHQAGDRCLQTVAALFASHGRRPTDLVARYGGEEFVLLMPATSGVHALAIAQEICQQLAQLALPHEPAAGGVVAVSIGVAAMAPGSDDMPETLIQCADQALYRAKREGRNRALLNDVPATAG